MFKLSSFMSRFLMLALFAFAILVLNSCSQYRLVDYEPYQVEAVNTAILNINVLSVDGNRILPNRNVLIKDKKISKITQSDLNMKGMKVIDGSGKYMIPGLVDSHAHLQNSPNDLLIYLAFGVTYLREMGGKSIHIKWRNQITNGRPGPKISVARVIGSASGVKGFFGELFSDRVNVASQQEAHEVIDELIEDGYDAIKVWSFMGQSNYQALAKAAKDKDLSIIGHIPDSVSLDEFWQAEQKEVVHIEEITKAFDREFGGYDSTTAKEYLAYVSSQSDDFALKLKQNNVSVGTTLWFMESLPKQALELKSLITSTDLTYTNPERVAEWLEGNNKFEISLARIDKDPKLKDRVKIFWDTYVEAIHILLKSLIKNDVVILAGADSMTSMVVPGHSIHDELSVLVNNGFSPSQAIKSATSAPGEWMNSNTGKVQEGYDADLLILTANPLEDISHTSHIDSVIFDGKILSKYQIDQIMKEVRAAYSHN